MDNLLDLLESEDKPFAKEETQSPGQNNTTDYNSKNSSKINLWEDTDIEPKKVVTADLHSIGKFFTILVFKGENGIPTETGDKLAGITKVMAKEGILLRYNGDNDPVYNKILDTDLSKVEMYLPWKKFNTNFTPKMAKPVEAAYHHAAYYHKAFKKLPNPVRTMLARDVHVLLGESCVNPIRFLVCYSSDGAETLKQINFKTTGNISFSISICDMLNIPVFNLGNKDAVSRLVEYVKTIN